MRSDSHESSPRTSSRSIPLARPASLHTQPRCKLDSPVTKTSVMPLAFSTSASGVRSSLCPKASPKPLHDTETEQKAKGDDEERREEAARGSQRTSAGSAETVSDATTRRDAVRLVCVLRWWL